LVEDTQRLGALERRELVSHFHEEKMMPSPSLLEKSNDETTTSHQKKSVALDFSHFFVESPAMRALGSSRGPDDRIRRNEKQQYGRKPREKLSSNNSTGKEKSHEPSALEWFNRTLNPYMEWNDFTKSTNTEHGFFARLRYQQRDALRHESQRIWSGSDMKHVRETIREEISRGEFRFRDDFDLQRNLDLRRRVLQLFSSYETEWLRLSLETIFNEAIIPSEKGELIRKLSDGFELPSLDADSPREDIKTTLRRFIVNRVLSDSKVLRKYTKGRCKVPSMKFEANYKAEIQGLVLYRLFVIVFFLDRAKSKGILTQRLFVRGSQVNSTSAFLHEFCKEFLAAEGNIMKHIARMGLEVCVPRPDPINEINFHTKQLRNLSDGFLLARLTEIESRAPYKSLLSKLKQPGNLLAQKLHNVKCVLDKLVERGIILDDEISVPDIVGGKEEPTETLLWTLAAQFGLQRLVNADTIQRETKSIAGKNTNVFDTTNKPLVDHLEALLRQWAMVVAKQYGVEAANIPYDFSDGVVWCLLIHHYLPSVIKLADIRPTSQSTSFMDPEANRTEARKNERCNVEFVCSVTSSIGGLENIIPMFDGANYPHKMAVVIGLARLFTRLQFCRREEVASKAIQRAVRRGQAKLWQKRKHAAHAIAHTWRRYKTKVPIAIGAIDTRKRRSHSCMEEEGDSVNQRRRLAGKKLEPSHATCDPSAKYSGSLDDYIDLTSRQARPRSLSNTTAYPLTSLEGDVNDRFDSMVSKARWVLYTKLVAPRHKRDPPGRRMSQPSSWEEEEEESRRVSWPSIDSGAPLIEPSEKEQFVRRKSENDSYRTRLRDLASVSSGISGEKDPVSPRFVLETNEDDQEVGMSHLDKAWQDLQSGWAHETNGGGGVDGMGNLDKAWQDLQIGWKTLKNQ